MLIDYPTEEQISSQKRAVLDAAFPAHKTRRPSFKIVFYNCRFILLISLFLYGFLLYLCLCMRLSGAESYIVLMIYPFTYFSFYFLSFLSEGQNGTTELKRSMKYSFVYLISLRMLYCSIGGIFLNLAFIGVLYSRLSHAWHLAAAGTTASLLLAMASLVLYEKTSSCRYAGLLLPGWLLFCGFLMRSGTDFYRLVIEVIPLAVHVAMAVFCLFAYIKYTKKVGQKYADCF